MMEEKTMVYVPFEAMQELCELAGRTAAFAEWVKNQQYSISRSDCAAMLGFKLPKGDKDE